MRKCTKILLLLLIPVLTHAQQHLPDTIRQAIKAAANDSLQYKANHEASLYFEEVNKDSALYYNNKCLVLSEKDQKKLVTARCLASKGYLLTGKGQYADALKYILQAFSIADDPKSASNSWFTDNSWHTNLGHSPEQTRLFVLALTHHMYGILMRSTHNTEQEIFHFKEARRIATLIKNGQRVMLADMNLGGAYLLADKTDSALFFLNEAKEMTLRIGPKKYLSFILMNLGDIALKKGDIVSEKNYYYDGITSAAQQKNQT